MDAWLFGNHLTGPNDALQYAQGTTILTGIWAEENARASLWDCASGSLLSAEPGVFAAAVFLEQSCKELSPILRNAGLRHHAGSRFDGYRWGCPQALERTANPREVI